jgi:hypothetical protein
MCPPLTSPRIIASAMFPAPMNPIDCPTRIDKAAAYHCGALFNYRT